MKSEIRKIYRLIGMEQTESVLKYLETHSHIKSTDLKEAIKQTDSIFYPATFALCKFGLIQKTIKQDESRSVYYDITEFGRNVITAQKYLMDRITKDKVSPQEDEKIVS